MNAEEKLKKIIKHAKALAKDWPEFLGNRAKPVSMREINREIAAYRKERRLKIKVNQAVAKKKRNA